MLNKTKKLAYQGLAHSVRNDRLAKTFKVNIPNVSCCGKCHCAAAPKYQVELTSGGWRVIQLISDPIRPLVFNRKYIAQSCETYEQAHQLLCYLQSNASLNYPIADNGSLLDSLSCN
ncbi:MAG: hypothetical protein AAFO07_04180 [Bacteroidota bacterium]